MKTTHVENALDEMNYEIVENSLGVELPCSKPAAFDFEVRPELNPDRLDSVFSSKGFYLLDEYENHDSESERWYYKFEICSTDDYKKIQVKMWPDTVRIYPRENQPDLCELAQITSAIEEACSSSLVHSPIEEDGDGR